MSATCGFIKKDGQPCQNKVMKGSDRCYSHKNAVVGGAVAAPAAGVRCHAYKANGEKCGSYALKGTQYCRNHPMGVSPSRREVVAGKDTHECGAAAKNGTCKNKVALAGQFCHLHRVGAKSGSSSRAGSRSPSPSAKFRCGAKTKTGDCKNIVKVRGELCRHHGGAVKSSKKGSVKSSKKGSVKSSKKGSKKGSVKSSKKGSKKESKQKYGCGGRNKDGTKCQKEFNEPKGFCSQHADQARE